MHVTSLQRLSAKISYSTNDSTWTYWGYEELSNKTVQEGILYLKIEPYTRGNVGTYAAGIDIKKAATAGCTYTLLPVSSGTTAGAGNSQIEVTAGPSCFRTATSNANWITLTSGQSATGSGNVAYFYKANMSTASRIGTITIAGQIFTFTHLGRPLTLDSYEPNNIVGEIAQASTFTPTFTDNADTVSISSASCHNSADIDIYKINLSPGYSYAISGALHNAYNQIDNSNYTLYGKVSYSTNGSDWTYWGNRQLSNKTMQGETFYLKIEPDSSGYVGTYAAKIDITRTVDCRPVLSLASSEVSSEAGTGQVIVTTNLLCVSSSWTATTATSWITLTSGLSGAGSGTVGYSYTANTVTSPRTGTITIAGQTYTLNQSSVVTGIETPSGVRIFPNPAKDFVTIDLSSTNIKYMSVKISNQLGQILYEVNNPNGKLQIPLKGLTAGLYFILLQGEEKAGVQKLVVE